MRSFLLASVLLVALAGCSDGPRPASAAEAIPVEEPAPSCEPADTNNYGIQVNGLYVEEGAWRETNGVPNLQKTETCEGPADTRVA